MGTVWKGALPTSNQNVVRAEMLAGYVAFSAATKVSVLVIVRCLLMVLRPFLTICTAVPPVQFFARMLTCGA